MDAARPSWPPNQMSERGSNPTLFALPLVAMRLIAFFSFLLLVAGCRSTDPYAVPDVPSDAAALVLHDDELPRTVYASVWGAFAVAGWEVVDYDADAFRLRVQAPDASAPVQVVVTPERENGRVVSSSALVTSQEPGGLEAAATVLATIPGDIAVR